MVPLVLLAAPWTGLIRARVRSGELVGYLVRGSGGAIYRVEAKGSWRCSCPDHHGRHRRRAEGSRACKHALACWALWRAAPGANSPGVAAGETERECGEASGEAEATRWGIEGRGLSREDLRALIEGSSREIPATEHRRLHQEEGNFVRWGRRGGRRTLALYGRPYFSLLARLMWGRVELEALTWHLAGNLKGVGRSDPFRVYNDGVRVHNREEAGGRRDHRAAARTDRGTARASRG